MRLRAQGGLARGEGGLYCLPRAAANVVPAVGLRRIAIAVVGSSVLLLGLALLVVPIPGTSVVVIPLGLTILAREFAWARRLRDRSTAIVRRTCRWTSGNVRRLFGARSVAFP